MTYYTQASMARSDSLLLRVTACAATQNLPDPQNWAWSHQWMLSAEPGWDAAYAYAVAAGNADPGGDAAVVTDAMILSAVQAIITKETPTP